MEKIKKTIDRKLPPLVLYLDDIQELYEFLKGIAKKTVVIETCNYRLNSPDELSKLKEEKTNSIAFECNEPYLSVNLYESGGSILISKRDIGDNEAEGIAVNIERILLSRKRSVVFSIVSKPYFIGSLCGFSVFLALSSKNSESFILPLFSLASFIVTVCGFVFGYLFSLRWYNTVFFKLRKESPSFWKRNKDQIIVGVVTAVITAIITSFVTAIITAKVTTKTSSISESNSQKETVQQDVNSH
jgi:hypothetical protein